MYNRFLFRLLTRKLVRTGVTTLLIVALTAGASLAAEPATREVPVNITTVTDQGLSSSPGQLTFYDYPEEQAPPAAPAQENTATAGVNEQTAPAPGDLQSSDNPGTGTTPKQQPIVAPEKIKPAPKEQVKPQFLTHQVVAGDSLFKISQHYKIKVKDLKLTNGLKSDAIQIGQVLTIPGRTVPSANATKVTTGRPARASMAPTASRGAPSLSREDIKLMARAVYSESRGESFEGQVAVASVILNRLANPRFPKTISGVLFQPGAFTAVDDGQFWMTPDDSAYLAVQAALDGWDPTNGAFYYYNPAVATSRWSFTRPVTRTIGSHVFTM